MVHQDIASGLAAGRFLSVRNQRQLRLIVVIGAVDVVAAALVTDFEPLQEPTDAAECADMQPTAGLHETGQGPAVLGMPELMRVTMQHMQQSGLGRLSRRMLRGKKPVCGPDLV